MRGAAKEGAALPGLITAEMLADDKLLKPVLEDDALIFSLDELPAPAATDGEGLKVDELRRENAQLQAEMEQLAKQFSNYRLTVEQTLDKRWGVDEEAEKAESAKAAAEKAAAAGEKKDGKEDKADESTYYFESYAYNGESVYMGPRAEFG